MGIRDWPESDRPREKLLARGAGTLSDTELLAIFLRTGVAGKSAVDLARELVAHFGDLRGLFNASQAEFCQANGVGPAKYAQLQAVLEMSRRYLEKSLPRRDPLSDPNAVRDYLKARLRDLQHEVFVGLFLDNRHRVIAFEELARGTLNAASVYPREVVKRALSLNAGAVIFAHNHPSGIAEPSSADRDLTRRLKQALALVEISVLDHFVVGDGPMASFAERGWL
ncbi:MAG: DNA repair protein RadC [Sinobacteraceae bacterium]|nr:DNA repair protein RadC [Nevskiaceae bacterium]